MVSISKVTLGCIAFVVWWVFVVFPKFPLLPVGRTAGSLLGATLMVVFQVISPHQAFAAVDLEILGLLFGTMVVSIYLEKAGLFKYIGKALSWRTRGGMDLLCRVSLLAAISSALFTNDTTCVLLTRFVLELCREKKLRAEPFLMALACSSNIGSAATTIGNPQNLVIAIGSDITFGRFLEGVLPAVAVGLVVNTLLLVLYYGRSLSIDSTSSQHTGDSGISRREHLQNVVGRDTPPVDSVTLGEVSVESAMRRTSSHQSREMSGPRVDSVNLEVLPVPNTCAAMLRRRLKLLKVFWRKHQQRIWKISVYLVTVGMLAALLAGLSLPWTAITAAVVMMILDFSDAGPSLDKVSYALLVFFSGMFIATSGFNATGLPGQFWSAVEPHSQIDTASGVIVLSTVVTVLSNVVSNVPTVILLGPRVAASAAGTSGASSVKAWLILAWVSTVAGNLTLVGSAANIIVCEQARETQAEKVLREGQSNDLSGDSQGPTRATYNLTFWNHLKFGIPSTLIVIAVGLFPIVLRKS